MWTTGSFAYNGSQLVLSFFLVNFGINSLKKNQVLKKKKAPS